MAATLDLSVMHRIPNCEERAMEPTDTRPAEVSAAPEAMTPAQLDRLVDALWPLLWPRVLDMVRRGALSTLAAESRSLDKRGQR